MKTQVKRKLIWVVAPPPQESPFYILEAEFKKRGLKCWNWGNGSMKTLPYSSEDYDVEEYDPAKVNIPQDGLQMLELAKGLVTVKRTIIAHEKNPVIELEPLPDWKPDVGKIKLPEWEKVRPVAIGLGVIALVAAAIVALPAILIGAAIVAGVTLDPSVIVELEDGTWAEVYFYFLED